ncbi:MAG: hypothetical protein MJ245_06775 [Clostridia bacterium]|nr:hypothetical protein [Clostridia bacterium]
MFVERLSKDQVYAYFKQVYPEYNVSGLSLSKDMWRAEVENPKSYMDYFWHEELKDFSASRNDEQWVKYLYHIFGEEYRKNYLEYFVLKTMESLPDCFDDVEIEVYY